jgi:hypothetical protein
MSRLRSRLLVPALVLITLGFLFPTLARARIGAENRCHPLPDAASPIVSPRRGARRPLGHSPVPTGSCGGSSAPESLQRRPASLRTPLHQLSSFSREQVLPVTADSTDSCSRDGERPHTSS